MENELKIRTFIREMIEDQFSGDKYTSFDLSDEELLEIAKWGLLNDFQFSGCWDEANDDLEVAAECAVGDFKLFMKNKWPKGFDGVPNNPIIYRFIVLKDESELNRNNLGYSWFSNPNQWKENTDFFGQLLHLRKQHREGKDLFLISAQVPISKIDIPRTFWQWSANYNENEIVLKDDSGIRVLNIQKIG